jgi:hypothetical protein
MLNYYYFLLALVACIFLVFIANLVIRQSEKDHGYAFACVAISAIVVGVLVANDHRFKSSDHSFNNVKLKVMMIESESQRKMIEDKLMKGYISLREYNEIKEVIYLDRLQQEDYKAQHQTDNVKEHEL